MKARDRILKAADELFGKAGFDATSTREIAEHSGVNKALIHYHFKNKDALLESLLDRYYERLRERLEKSLRSEGGLRERLRRLVDAYLDFLDRNRNFSRIVQREASGGRHVERVHVHMIPLFELGTELVRASFPSTTAGDLAAEQLLISFYGMIISYFTYKGVLQQLLGADPLSRRNLQARKEHILRMVDIVVDAVEQDEACGSAMGEVT